MPTEATPPPHRGIMLTKHDGSREAGIPLRLPTLPDRRLLLRAMHAAMGYTDADNAAQAAENARAREERREAKIVPPSRQFSRADHDAVVLAALGLCLPASFLMPALRDFDRDVVAYGEHVTTQLYDADWTDPNEHVEQGIVAIEWLGPTLSRLGVAREREIAGFARAPTPTSDAGAPYSPSSSAAGPITSTDSRTTTQTSGPGSSL